MAMEDEVQWREHEDPRSAEYASDDLESSGDVPAAPEQTLTARQEIERLLEDDQSRLGDVYRLHVLDGLSPQEVADRLNIGSKFALPGRGPSEF